MRNSPNNERIYGGNDIPEFIKTLRTMVVGYSTAGNSQKADAKNMEKAINYIEKTMREEKKQLWSLDEIQKISEKITSKVKISKIGNTEAPSTYFANTVSNVAFKAMIAMSFETVARGEHCGMGLG